MAMLFKKPEPTPNNGDPGNGKPTERKSTWQLMLDHLNAAEHHLQQFQNLLSVTGFDFQKPLDFIALRRDSLIKAFEEAGGQIEQGSVEEQIRDYIPKALQRDRADEAN
jgi:hypothetical protein